MRIELHGTNTAKYTHNKTHHEITTSSKKGPLGPLCRILIKEGFHASNMVEVYRNSTPVFAPAPLSHYADFDVTESDTTGLKRRTYVEFTGF